MNIKEKQEAYEEFDTDRNSFLSLYMGFNLPLSKYDLDEGNVFQTSTGKTTTTSRPRRAMAAVSICTS